MTPFLVCLCVCAIRRLKSYSIWGGDSTEIDSARLQLVLFLFELTCVAQCEWQNKSLRRIRGLVLVRHENTGPLDERPNALWGIIKS